jgi:hypothetical protein
MFVFGPKFTPMKHALIGLICTTIFLFLMGCGSKSPDKGPSSATPSTPETSQPAAAESVPQVDFHFSPAVSVIEGILHQVTFFGPPGFGSDPDHDTQEECFVLTLKHPINVMDDANAPTNKDGFTQIEGLVDIQLIPGNANLPKYKGLKMRITGQFIKAQTTHHFTSAVMNVEHIEEL